MFEKVTAPEGRPYGSCPSDAFRNVVVPARSVILICRLAVSQEILIGRRFRAASAHAASTLVCMMFEARYTRCCTKMSWILPTEIDEMIPMTTIAMTSSRIENPRRVRMRRVRVREFMRAPKRGRSDLLRGRQET